MHSFKFVSRADNVLSYFVFNCLPQGPIVIAAALVIIELCKILYRLIWHPLSRYPGPRAAAVTSLYAACYDLFVDGSFVKTLPKLHRLYGPVVRIGPNELHIDSLDCFNDIFRIGTDFVKTLEYDSIRVLRGSLIAIPTTHAARHRKEAYARYFSKIAIQNIEPLIQSKLNRFLKLLREAANSDEYIDLCRGFRCLSAEIIMDYTYKEDFGALNSFRFTHPVIEAAEELISSAPWQTYFPKTFALLDSVAGMMPDWLLGKLSPQLLAIEEFQRTCAQNIRKLREMYNASNSNISTIFDRFLSPKENTCRVVPSSDELTADAVLMLLAGMDTTANALIVGTWGILQSPHIKVRLTKELRDVFPDQSTEISTDVVERLPYLNAVIKEALRLSYGSTGRLQRVVPEDGTVIEGIAIPAGVIVSHSTFVYHNDERYFRNPSAFIPERWLSANSSELDKRMLSFSRGSRMCLGMHLTYAELRLTFARIFHSLEFRIHDTLPKDLEWKDCGVPVFKGHLKVMVIKRESL